MRLISFMFIVLCCNHCGVSHNASSNMMRVVPEGPAGLNPLINGLDCQTSYYYIPDTGDVERRLTLEHEKFLPGQVHGYASKRNIYEHIEVIYTLKGNFELTTFKTDRRIAQYFKVPLEALAPEQRSFNVRIPQSGYFTPTLKNLTLTTQGQLGKALENAELVYSEFSCTSKLLQ